MVKMEDKAISTKETIIVLGKTIIILLVTSFIISWILLVFYVYPAMMYCPPDTSCELPRVLFELPKVWVGTAVLSLFYYLYRKLGDQAIFKKTSVQMLLGIFLIISTILFFLYIHPPSIHYCISDETCGWQLKVVIESALIAPLIITFIGILILYYLYRRFYLKKLATNKLENQTIFTTKTILVLLIMSLIIPIFLFDCCIYPAITYYSSEGYSCLPYSACYTVSKTFIVLAFVTLWIITFLMLSIFYYLYRRLYQKKHATKRGKNEL
jgi:hypothetical protein